MSALKVAAKPDATPGSINLCFPYWVFTTVNRNETMNTNATTIACPASDPCFSSTDAGAFPGTRPGISTKRVSGIRGAGQYCSPLPPVRTEPLMTALCATRGMMAVRGMCP